MPAGAAETLAEGVAARRAPRSPTVARGARWSALEASLRHRSAQELSVSRPPPSVLDRILQSTRDELRRRERDAPASELEQHFGRASVHAPLSQAA